MRPNKLRQLVKECVIEVLKEDLEREAFDPTSMGPNPEATEGTQYNPYEEWNEKMRHLEEDNQEDEGGLEFLSKAERETYDELLDKFLGILNREYQGKGGITRDQLLLRLIMVALVKHGKKKSDQKGIEGFAKAMFSSWEKEGELIDKSLQIFGVDPKELEAFYHLRMKADNAYDAHHGKLDEKELSSNPHGNYAYSSGAGQFDPRYFSVNENKKSLGLKYKDFLACFGLDENFKNSKIKRKTFDCPKCHKKNATKREAHADTGMDDIVMECPDCRYSSDK